MSQRTELLERERKKLDWLLKKVDEQRARVKALEQIQDDPLDAMFERELRSSSVGEEHNSDQKILHAPTEKTSRADSFAGQLGQLSRGALPPERFPRRIPYNWVSLLTFIGRDGKTLAEVEKFVEAHAFKMKAGSVRTGLMNYRKDFGFVENPRAGFYVATDKALNVISNQMNKEKSPATEHSEALGARHFPLAGTVASTADEA